MLTQGRRASGIPLSVSTPIEDSLMLTVNSYSMRSTFWFQPPIEDSLILTVPLSEPDCKRLREVRFSTPLFIFQNSGEILRNRPEKYP
jgi:hypothetical protein